MTNRTLAALSLSAAIGLAAPALAQEGEAGRAAALDRLLGANADLPKPDPAPQQTLTWLPAPLPPWIAAQPYRQQPLFATVPVGGTTVSGRRRGSGP
jgi:hypothetical protein